MDCMSVQCIYNTDEIDLNVKRWDARDAADALENWVFPVMGPPSILQSDNGREFVNKDIEEMAAAWPGQVHSVIGIRHPGKN